MNFFTVYIAKHSLRRYTGKKKQIYYIHFIFNSPSLGRYHSGLLFWNCHGNGT